MQYDAKITARLKRVEGQLRGVLRMMEEQQDCKSVTTQLSAVCSAVDRTIGVVVTENLVSCMSDEHAEHQNHDELVEQAMQLLLKSR